MTYTVWPCGQVDIEFSYDPAEGLGPMPEFGMLFKLDANCNQMRWYCLGPKETYADRYQGGKLGI